MFFLSRGSNFLKKAMRALQYGLKSQDHVAAGSVHPYPRQPHPESKSLGIPSVFQGMTFKHIQDTCPLNKSIRNQNKSLKSGN